MIITGEPYDFPLSGELLPARSALLIIDMQRDFCDPLGYMNHRGDDITAARAIIPAITQVREAATRVGIKVIYTREGHRPDLSDLPLNKRLKTARAGAEIGMSGPLGRLLVRGEPGWDLVPELWPRDRETVIDKPGTGTFHGTDLHHILVTEGIQNLILTGVTTGVCVSSTAREASDRGYGVLVLSDCCAEPDPANHAMAIQLLKIEGGYMATVSTAVQFLAALAAYRPDAISLSPPLQKGQHE